MTAYEVRISDWSSDGCASDIGPPWRRAARRQGGSWASRLDRSRQGVVRRAWRGPGNGRHLRFCGGPLAPALRTLHSLRTQQSPARRTMAPDRSRWRHLGLQLSRRGLVLELRARIRLRGFGGLEAVGGGDADRLGDRKRVGEGKEEKGRVVP